MQLRLIRIYGYSGASDREFGQFELTGGLELIPASLDIL